MTSHSELDDIGKWPWSIVPTRAFGDSRLNDADRRVLGALCAFVNRAGVCWPALDTMQDISGYATRKSVFDAIQRLKQSEAPHVLLQLEDRGATVVGLVGADPLEDSESVVQGMRQDVDSGIRPVHEAAVQPDLAAADPRARCAHGPSLEWGITDGAVVPRSPCGSCAAC